MSKGLIYMLISNVVWMGSGFVVHLVTGRLLGPTSYGTFGIIYAFISTSYIVLGGGVKRAVTKYVAGAPDQAGDIRLVGLKVQLYICAVITVLLLIASAPISVWLHDEHLKIYIRYSICIVPVAGVLYIYIGYFDGCKQFGRSAIVTIAHSIIKIIFVFGLLLLGYEIFGVITGLLVGLGGALIIAIFLGRYAPVIQRFEQKKIIQFALPVLSFFICISVLSYLDLFFVKALLDDPAETGYYTAAQTISRLISFAMVPFGIVLLPSISYAIAENDLNMVQKYISGSLRYILIIIVPACMLLSITAEQILIHVYGIEYAFGATSLSILFVGASCWGLTNAMVAIIQGYGQPGRPAMIFAIMIPINIVLIQIFIRKFGIEGAAIGTAGTFAIGMILAGITIYKRYSTLINIRTVLNIFVASIVACALFIFITPSGFFLSLCYMLAFCIYTGVLWILGELKREDMDLLYNAISLNRSR